MNLVAKRQCVIVLMIVMTDLYYNWLIDMDCIDSPVVRSGIVPVLIAWRRIVVIWKTDYG